MTREQAIETVARIICKLVGIEPVDSLDGSSNWWLFNEQAEYLINDLAKRGFLDPLWYKQKDEK